MQMAGSAPLRCGACGHDGWPVWAAGRSIASFSARANSANRIMVVMGSERTLRSEPRSRLPAARNAKSWPRAGLFAAAGDCSSPQRRFPSDRDRWFAVQRDAALQGRSGLADPRSRIAPWSTSVSIDQAAIGRVMPGPLPPAGRAGGRVASAQGIIAPRDTLSWCVSVHAPSDAEAKTR